MSRFNTLYLGEPGDAADALEAISSEPERDHDLTRVALINALRRIERLENQVANLRRELAE